MVSNQNILMGIRHGVAIIHDSKSFTQASKNHFVHPQNTQNLLKDGDNLCFQGGNDFRFGFIDIEIWGLN